MTRDELRSAQDGHCFGGLVCRFSCCLGFWLGRGRQGVRQRAELRMEVEDDSDRIVSGHLGLLRQSSPRRIP